MRSFFISDLHLSAQNQPVNALFQHFLSEIAPTGQQLFILGDFFEYWLGTDIMDEFQRSCLEQLRQLSQKGIAIYFLYGNRDFLISQSTLAHYGIRLLPDISLHTLAGKKILLCHGDHLCTLDIQYQRYKKLARNPLIKWLFLHSTQKFRHKLASKIHNKNPHTAEAERPDYALADATEEAILKEIKTHQPDLIIHGHTHRMGLHWHTHSLRVVLGDWHQYGNYLMLTQDDMVLKSFRLAALPHPPHLQNGKMDGKS